MPPVIFGTICPSREPKLCLERARGAGPAHAPDLPVSGWGADRSHLQRSHFLCTKVTPMKKQGTFGSSIPKGDFSRLSGERLKDAKRAAFFDDLAENGRPNWKKAPREVKNQSRGVFLILFSIPVILIPGWEIYKRLSGKSTKRVQEGELGDDLSIRRFDEMEKWKTERDSFLYKIFGKDFYLDGFTAKTMKRSEPDAALDGSATRK